MTARQILAFGGGGFSMEAAPYLDDHVIECARSEQPLVCFLPTASGDAAPYIARFYRAFALRACYPTDLTVIEDGGMPRRPIRDDLIEEFLCEQDVIYVGGGNTANMLARWRDHGIDRALKKAWEGGTLLTGLSAGLNCWFQCSVTDSFGPLQVLEDGLGLVDGSACPHYDGEADRRPTYHRLIAGGMPAGYACDDGVALHFVDGALHEIVSSRERAAAYRVELVDGNVIETRIAPRYLGESAAQ